MGRHGAGGEPCRVVARVCDWKDIRSLADPLLPLTMEGQGRWTKQPHLDAEGK